MGNTVSAAEIIANELTKNVKLSNQNAAIFDHTNIKAGQEIPPECPMHQKQKVVVSANECPVKHDDVNPLNMVRDLTRNFQKENEYWFESF